MAEGGVAQPVLVGDSRRVRRQRLAHPGGPRDGRVARCGRVGGCRSLAFPGAAHEHYRSDQQLFVGARADGSLVVAVGGDWQQQGHLVVAVGLDGDLPADVGALGGAPDAGDVAVGDVEDVVPDGLKAQDRFLAEIEFEGEGVGTVVLAGQRRAVEGPAQWGLRLDVDRGAGEGFVVASRRR